MHKGEGLVIFPFPNVVTSLWEVVITKIVRGFIMKVSIKKTDEIEQIVFETLFYGDASPICLMENALRWSSGLCGLISSHAGEAALRRNEDTSFDFSPEGISVAAELSRNLMELCHRTTKLLREEYCVEEIGHLDAENDVPIRMDSDPSPERS